MTAKHTATLLGLVALAVFPFVVTSPYYVHLVMVIAIFSIVTLGLDVVFGYTGEVSLGHSALVGIGAYTAGVLAFQLGCGFAAALPFAILITALFGAILALPALRVTGPYLAMVTLAFGTIVQILINEMTFLTNGPLGISLRQPVFFDFRDYGESLPFLEMSLARMRNIEFYYVVIVCLLLTLVVINRLLASRYGRAFEALRDITDRVRLHGRQRLQAQGVRLRRQRRIRRPRRRAVRLFRAVYRAEQFQLRPLDHLPARA